MSGKQSQIEKDRLIHVRLTTEEHKRLRIVVAALDTTIQEWVHALVVKELEKQRKERS